MDTSFADIAPSGSELGGPLGETPIGTSQAPSQVPAPDGQLPQEQSHQPQSQPQPDLAKEISRLQSIKDKEVAEARRQAAHEARLRAEREEHARQLEARLAQIEQSQKQAEYEAKLRAAQTPQERAQVEYQHYQEQLKQQQSELERRQAEIEAREAHARNVESLRLHERRYTERLGVPQPIMHQINETAWENAQGDLSNFHEWRQFLVDEFMVAREQGVFKQQPAQQQAPLQQTQGYPQQAPQQGYGQQGQRPQAPAVARPTGQSAAPPDPSQYWGQDWTAYRREASKLFRKPL